MDRHSLERDGWRCVEADGFIGLVGPFWLRDQGDTRETGMILEARHCNNHLGTMHGGIAMTLADIGLGGGVAKVVGEQRFGFVTASLQTQFVSVARIGEFITCHPEVIRATRQLIFVRGLIKTGDKVVASAEGVWKLLDSATGNRS